MVYSPKALEGTPLRRVLPFSHRPLVAIARSARLLCCQHPHRLDIWRLGVAADQDGAALAPGTVLPLQQSRRKAVEIHLRDPGNLVCSAISEDGQWIAASDANKLSLFRLEHNVRWMLKAVVSLGRAE